MTTHLRLMVYPPADLIHLAGFTHPAPTLDQPPCISCLLHAASLPAGHSLDVHVRDTLVQGQSEGEQQVFSWQCAAGDAIRLTLWQRGRSQREWLGCWNGEQALLHAGTLPVQVFFADVPQPEVDPVDLLPLLATSNANGHREADSNDDLRVLARPSPTEACEQPSDESVPTTSNTESLAAEPLFHATRASTENALKTPEVPISEATLPGPSSAPSAQQAPTGTLLATWYADSRGEEAWSALATRLAQMPARTLLVDLRQHPRKASRLLTTDPLSKQALRLALGARYFDRGWAIRIVQHPHPDQSNARLYSVITNPTDPEGIPLLIDRLLHGYSLLLMDRTARYEESARAAVVTLLRQQVGNVTMGTLS